ncbi:hypothetical protein [Endozoicomonas sp. ALE010]|uniref:hypothetical protein n=1 Tax=Endozoicomonas sp. ALE010 TaxID=3403081 RepID=UPI003BB7E5C9
MDKPTSSQLSPAPNGPSNIQGTPLAESGATGQAFSRLVTEVRQPVTNHDMTDQSTSSDNQGYLNPKKKWLEDFAVQNQTNYKESPAIAVAIPLENYQVAEYDPENNTFLIYSFTKGIQSTSQNSTDVDTKLNPPIQIPNQEDIGNFSKSTSPIAIITPQLKSEYLQQYTSPATQAEEAIDESSSQIECQRELRKAPTYAERRRERQRQRQRERYQADPAYAERERERKRKCQRKRYRTDPVYVERQKERQKERQRKLRKDPVYVERQRELQRERKRERYQTDPAYAERQRALQRDRQRKLRKDPAYVERQRERQRELRKDPAYTQRERERKKQYRQSANSAKNSVNLPPTSKSAETTPSSSKNFLNNKRLNKERNHKGSRFFLSLPEQCQATQ